MCDVGIGIGFVCRAAALKMEWKNLPHSRKTRPFAFAGDAPCIRRIAQDVDATIQFFLDAPYLRRIAPSRQLGRDEKGVHCAMPWNRGWFLSAVLRR